MTTENKEVVTNDYGIDDKEYDKQRAEARAFARGQEPPKQEVVEVKETPAPEKQAEAEATKEQPQAAAEVETPAKPSKKTVQPDPLAEFPEDIRDKIASLIKADRQHREKSDEGRVAAYQTKYEEARREAAELKQAIAAQKKVPQKKLVDLSPRFKELAEIDEDSVVPFEELRNQIKAELKAEMEDQLKAVTQPILERDQQKAVEEFNKTLDTQCQNWREIVYAVDDTGRIQVDDKGIPKFSQQWTHFLNEQPLGVRSAMVNVSSPDEALWAIDQHVQWLQKNGFVQEEETPEEEAPTAQNPDADKILQKRQADLKKVAPQKSAQLPLTTAPSENITDEQQEARLRKAIRESIRKNDPSIYKNAR